MKLDTSLDFGSVIAFLLPGLVGVFALTYVADQARDLIALAIAKDTAIGGSLLLVLVAITVGVILSAFRSLGPDRLLYLVGSRWPRVGVKHVSLDFGSLRDRDTLASFQGAVQNTFRFAQFYGNVSTATAGLLLAKVSRSDGFRSDAVVNSLLVVAVVVSILSYRNELAQTYAVLGDLLQGEQDADQEAQDSPEENHKEEGQETRPEA